MDSTKHKLPQLNLHQKKECHTFQEFTNASENLLSVSILSVRSQVHQTSNSNDSQTVGSFLPRLESFVRKNELPIFSQAEKYLQKNINFYTLIQNEIVRQFKYHSYEVNSSKDKQFLYESVNSRDQKKIKVSTDNYSGNILLHIPTEGSDRFQSQFSHRSQKQGKVDKKIHDLREEIIRLYEIAQRIKLDEKDNEQFQFMTQVNHESDNDISLNTGTKVLLGQSSSAIFSNSPQPKVSSLQNMLDTENKKNTPSDISKDSSQFSKLWDNSKSKSLHSFQERLKKESNLNVKEKFTQVAMKYSKAIQKTIQLREEEDPKKKGLRKKKEPKLVIFNSMQKEGSPANNTEHLMRVFNKEHTLSQVTVCLPSFHPKLDLNEQAIISYMGHHKPIKISKEMKVEDMCIPRQLRDVIEKDIQNFRSGKIGKINNLSAFSSHSPKTLFGNNNNNNHNNVQKDDGNNKPESQWSDQQQQMTTSELNKGFMASQFDSVSDKTLTFSNILTLQTSRETNEKPTNTPILNQDKINSNLKMVQTAKNPNRSQVNFEKRAIHTTSQPKKIASYSPQK